MTTILTINAGSSSLKVSLFYAGEETAYATASIEGIGVGQAIFVPEIGDSKETHNVTANDHHDAAAIVKEWIQSTLKDGDDVQAAAYRVVHGGDRFKDATIIDDEVVSYLEDITPLAPNHMPPAVACIRAFRETYPEIMHVACFDTAFFHDVPEVARTLALPKRLREQNLRRYGFHGLSYEYLIGNLAEHEGTDIANGRTIIAHLGSGASIAALKDGHPIDMTMGLTPASGIVMSTRSGDIDPGLFDFLMKEEGASAETIRNTLYKESGLLGVSETTADMRQLLADQATDPRAKLAIDLFCYIIRKQIGAYTAALGGVDNIVFSAGIGERSAPIREHILEALTYLGFELNTEANNTNERRISTEDSRVGVYVIPTREDAVLVKKATELLG